LSKLGHRKITNDIDHAAFALDFHARARRHTDNEIDSIGGRLSRTTIAPPEMLISPGSTGAPGEVACTRLCLSDRRR
jgi:hypothetical protein